MVSCSLNGVGRLALVICCAVVPGACVDINATDLRHVEREEKRFTTDDHPMITLGTFDGAIEVNSWDRPEVLVVVEKQGLDREAVASIHVELEQQGNDVTVKVTRRSGEEHLFGWHNHRSAALFITAPRNATVRAKSGDGRITVRDLHGEISVATGDGSIHLEDVAGAIDAQSGDGSILVDGALTRVRARSGDGRVIVRAGNGSVAQDDWTISTGDGSVTVELPDRFNAELDAHSGDGRVRVDDVNLAMERRDHRSTVRGRLGDGGRDLRVRTGDGSITIRRH